MFKWDWRCAAVQLMLSTNPSYDNRTIASTLKIQIWIATNNRDVPRVMKTKFLATVMVFGVVSSEGHIMPPHIFEVGLKVNTKVYLDVLMSVVIPWCNQVASGRPWVWQHDSASAHKSKETQAWLQKECYDFVPFSPKNLYKTRSWLIQQGWNSDILPLVDHSVVKILILSLLYKPTPGFEVFGGGYLKSWLVCSNLRYFKSDLLELLYQRIYNQIYVVVYV